MNKKTRKHLHYDKKRDHWVVDSGGRTSRRRKYFKSRREAEDFMESDVFLITSGLKERTSIAKQECFTSISVHEATQWYLKNITATTKSRYSQIWEPMAFGKFSEYFKGKQLHEIGLSELLEYQSHLLKMDGLQPQTVNRRFNSIRSFFRTFEETKGIPNPCRRLKKLKVAEQQHYDVLDEHEQKRLVLAALPWVRPLIQLANITGMRRSELINLRIPAVNLEEGNLIIESSEGFQTKNRKSRRLPLTEEMVKIFSPLVLEAKRKGRVGKNDFIFVDDREKPIGPDRLTRVLKKLMRRTLQRKQGSVHILRHSALTSMIRHGADIESVRRIAGHSSLTVTQRYLASTDDQMRQALSRNKASQIGGTVRAQPLYKGQITNTDLKGSESGAKDF